MARCITVLCALGAAIAFVKAEDGAECIFRCVSGNAESGNATSRHERSTSYMVLAKRAAPAVEAQECSSNTLKNCVQACPSSKLDPIVKNINDIIAKHCDDREATINLANNIDALRKKWVPKVDSCVNSMNATDKDGFCRQATSCIFDTLEEMRSEFSDEARAFGAGFFLLGFDTGIFRRYGSLPPTCDPLFDNTYQRDKSVAKSPEQDGSFTAKFRNFLRTFQRSR